MTEPKYIITQSQIDEALRRTVKPVKFMHNLLRSLKPVEPMTEGDLEEARFIVNPNGEQWDETHDDALARAMERHHFGELK